MSFTWETLFKESDGKVSVGIIDGSGDGKAVVLRESYCGKMEVVADKRVNSVLDIVSILDPTDPKVIGLANKAAADKGLELKAAIAGIKVTVLVGGLYALVFKAKNPKDNTSKVYLAAVLDTFFTTTVILVIPIFSL